MVARSILVHGSWCTYVDIFRVHCLRVELVGHMLCASSALADVSKLFFKVVAPITLFTTSVKTFWLSYILTNIWCSQIYSFLPIWWFYVLYFSFFPLFHPLPPNLVVLIFISLLLVRLFITLYIYWAFMFPLLWNVHWSILFICLLNSFFSFLLTCRSFFYVF